MLPGGLLEQRETAREAAVREVREEVGIDVEATGFVSLYDDPDRDERCNVGAAYRCHEIDEDADPRPVEEATRVGWFPPGELPAMRFDHREIVEGAVG